MIRFIVVILIFLNISSVFAYPVRHTRPYDNNWYIRVDKNPYANIDRKYFDAPPAGTKAKPLNKVQRILYAANRQHPSLYYQYQPHVSNREYSDCTYYKYVDCSNYAFCRCWQCRDYVYPYRGTGRD